MNMCTHTDIYIHTVYNTNNPLICYIRKCTILADLRAEIERLTSLLATSGTPLSASQLFQNNVSHASDIEELQKKLKEAEKLMTECTR